MTGSNNGSHGTPTTTGRQVSGRNGGGNGHDVESRLRNLEIQVTRIDERLRGIQENMAKKDDISKLKIWILGGVLGAILAGASIAAAVVKVFFF